MADSKDTCQVLPVSVILCTYRPDWNKLRATILSVVKQEGISFELLITDDGSACDFFPETKQLLDSIGFTNYRLIKNEENVGTVRNLLGAVKQARGEYTFNTSPGDMLFDSGVLARLCSFARERNAEVCFCDAVYYDPTDGVHPVGGICSAPRYPQLFNEDASLKQQQTSLIWGNYVLGATILNRRENAVKYYELVCESARFIEDTFSLMYMSLDGIRIHRFPEPGVWYEYGTGVSTSTDSAAYRRMKTDMDNTFRLLSGYRPYTPALAARCRIRFLRNPLLRVLYLLFCHPLLTLQLLRIFTLKKSIMDVSGVSTEWPEAMLNLNNNP